MITLDPGTMAGMTDEHLLASLRGEHITPCERELLKRWECALDTIYNLTSTADIVKDISDDDLKKLVALPSFTEIYARIDRMINCQNYRIYLYNASKS